MQFLFCNKYSYEIFIEKIIIKNGADDKLEKFINARNECNEKEGNYVPQKKR